MSAASDNLRANQRQLDMDGCEVGVSRQAVEETLAEYDAMVEAMSELFKLHGQAKRDEWLSDQAWEHAIIVTEKAAVALATALLPMPVPEEP